MRWILLLILIICWSMATAYRLQAAYEPRTIEMELRGIHPAGRIETILQDSGVREMTLEYRKPYRNGWLIMTTGGESRLQHVSMTEGSLLTRKENLRAVIGDSVALERFGSYQILGRPITIDDVDFRVTGVLHRSGDVMISYGADRLHQGWVYQTLRFLPPEGPRPEIRIRDVERALALNDVSWSRQIRYNEVVQSHQNRALLAAVALLILGIVQLMGYTRQQIRMIGETWQEQKNTTHGGRFLMGHRPLHVLLMWLLGTGVCGWIILSWVVKHFKMPEGFLPENLFSPGSWYQTLSDRTGDWLILLEQGMRGIRLQSFLSTLGLWIVLILMLAKWALETHKDAV
jgi:hypothetical protein